MRWRISEPTLRSDPAASPRVCATATVQSRSARECIGRSLGPRSTRPSRALEPWAPWSTRLVRAVHRAPAAPGLDGGLACVVAGGKCRGYRGPSARTALDGECAPECLYAVAQTC